MDVFSWGSKRGDFVIESVDGLWKAWDNSFMARVKTLHMDTSLGDNFSMLQFSASVEPVGDVLPASISLLRALIDTDLYALMPSRPGKRMRVTSCDTPTVTGGCTIYGHIMWCGSTGKASRGVERNVI